MKKIKIMTPENIEVEYTLAGLGSRTAAAFVDGLIQLVIIGFLALALFLIAKYSPELWGDYYGWIIGISIIILTLIIYGYFIVMELTTNGQTLGKKLLKLRTIRNNGQPVTIKHSAIRNLFKIFVDLAGVGIVVMFFNKEYKRVGDLAASTIVVAEDKKEAPVTLENLLKSSSNVDYYLSDEEQQLLRDYYNRKANLRNYAELREELKAHFRKKFETLRVLEQYERFLDEL
jgi:uncharacterized RDD family membrane protein YckC